MDKFIETDWMSFTQELPHLSGSMVHVHVYIGLMGDSHRKSRKINLYIKYFVSFDSKTDIKSFAQTRKIVMKGQIEF